MKKILNFYNRFRTPGEDMRLPLDSAQMKKAAELIRENASFETSRKVAAAGGAMPEMTQAMSLAPGVLRVMDAFGRNIYPNGRLERSLAEKIIIRVSEINSCQFCAGIHNDELKKGLKKNSAPANARESAALRYAEQVTKDANRVSDELFASVREHFLDEELAVLTFFIGFMNCLNRFNNALQVEYRGGYPRN